MNDRILNFIKYHPIRTQRGLEILTGLVPWSIILFPFVGSFFIPEIVAYFVITFNVYWLYRSLQMAVYAVSGYLNIKATGKIDWLEKLKSEALTGKKYSQIKHLVIISNYKEPAEVITRNLDSILTQNFPTKQAYIVIGMEEREGNPAKLRAKEIMAKYRGKFAGLIFTYHPLIAGETSGKHSNEAFAAREGKRVLVDQDNIPMENIILTTADADCIFDRQYFPLLTYRFLNDQNRYENIFQAPLFMYNNIAKAPLLVRVPSIISGIYFLSILHKHSKRFVNYSTYSLSLKLLHSVNYWDVDYIPEDAHLFFKIYFARGGKVQVVPLFVPVNMDAAESPTRMSTYRSSYQQNKRWAWGVVDIPYVVKNFFLHPEIPWWDKFLKISFAIEWHFVWSSFWFLLTLGATVPTIVNPVFARTALGLNLSRMSSAILTMCLGGILTILVLDVLLNPQYKNKLKAFLHPFTYLQWLILPVTGFLFGSLPGLESQTRLMLGKYLEYRVTEKVVK